MHTLLSITVYYDGSCPLCLREVSHYQRLKPVSTVQWIDVSKPYLAVAHIAPSRRDALKRFHVRDATSRMHSGAMAFAVLWKQYRWWRVLGTLVAMPIVRHVAEGVYRLFLLVRPAIQRIFSDHYHRHSA